MALVRCPQCGRVADGISCFACGFEWSEAPAPAVDPNATQGVAPDPPPSEESAPVVIEEPAPQRSQTPPPVSIPEFPNPATQSGQGNAPPAGGQRSGLTADLSEVLDGLEVPESPSLGSDSLEFDLGSVASASETPSADVDFDAIPSAQVPTPADDPLSIAFAMDGLDLADPAAASSSFPAIPEPAPPPQLPDDFDIEFGEVPAAPPPEDVAGVPPPEPLADDLGDDIGNDFGLDLDSALDDSMGSDLDALEEDIDLDFMSATDSSADPLDDNDALAAVDLGTAELNPDELLAASVPEDPDDFGIDVEEPPAPPAVVEEPGLAEPPAMPSVDAGNPFSTAKAQGAGDGGATGDSAPVADGENIAAALEAFGAPEIPSAMRLDDADAADDFDPFGGQKGGPPPTPPPIPNDSDELDAARVPPLDSAEAAIDGLGEMEAVPEPPKLDDSSHELDLPEIPYRERLLARLASLGETLENDGRFDDAAVCFETEELLRKSE